MLKKIYIILKLIGVDFYLLWLTIKGTPAFFSNLFQYLRLSKSNPHFKKFNVYPILSDRFSEAGTAHGHYFHQDLWVAQNIFKNNPVKHVDVGSRIDGFVAHVAAFRPIEVFDIRPYPNQHNNITFVQADFSVPNKHVDYCDSISCLHALEHFGLGRFGDPVDPNGYLKGFDNMTKMLQTGGTFYFAVPIGAQRVEFNAHRVFSLQYLLQLFANFQVTNFSYVNDKGELFTSVTLTPSLIESNCQCNYGCGIFILKKI